MKRSTLFWGTLLVLAGSLLLLDNLNLLPFRMWDLFWPSVLILLGGWILVNSFSSKRSFQSEHMQIPREGTGSVKLKVNHGAGRLRVSTGAGPENLAEGDFVGGLDLRMDDEGQEMDVEMSVPSRNFPTGPWFWGRHSLDWDVKLNPEVPMMLDIRTGANEADINLAGLQVTEVRLSTGASSTRLALPDSAGFTQVKIEAGAASVSVRVPSGVAASIHAEGGLASISVDKSRFEPQGSGYYQSKGYDSAENKVEMNVSAGVGSVDIR